jgi:tetratricopeptide (TPR) repeat protein
MKGASPALLCLLCALAAPAAAQQYRSEVRELPAPPPQEQVSAEQLLRQTTDPYARALLLRELAAQAAREGDAPQAAKFLEQALATKALSGPAEAQLREQLTQVLLASGDYKRMQGELEARVRRGDAAPEIKVALAAAYLDDKRYRDAIPLLREAIAATQQPDLSWRRALMGALIGAEQYREALPLLEALLREDPRQPEDWSRLAALHLRAGNKARAAAVLEIAQRLGYLQSADDRLRLVGLTAELGAPFEAGSLLQGWMRSGELPVNAANRRLLAQLWLAARESQLAVPVLEDVVRDSGDVNLMRQLAQQYLDREAYRDAARVLEQVVAKEGRKSDTLMLLATARYQQADIEGALEAFREAAALRDARAELAREWIKYLETGRAREQALAAAASRAPRVEEAVTLSSRIGGATVDLGPGLEAGAVAASAVDRGPRLTPVGAERAGNASGEIPAWEGGLTPDRRPAGFVPGKALPDPFPEDRPRYTVTAENLGRYAERVSPAHQQLLRTVPGYRLPVYPTRRSVAYPQAIYEATAANRTRARLESPDALVGAQLGFPFPEPRTGVEIMWNHRTRYRGDTVDVLYSQMVVQPDGRKLSRNKQLFRTRFHYANIADPADLTRDNYVAQGVTHLSETGRSPDIVALFHETVNSERQSRNVWVLLAKAGRMLRIPPVGYDQPFPGSEGIEFVDMVDMYNGAFDRYVWKLTGKREMLIPYNAYRLNLPARRYDELLQPRALDPTHARYELHRVWVIEATERGGARHSFGKRVFYVDEDSWTVVMVENYDRAGNLWRFQEGHLVAEYDIQAAWARPVITYDLKDGRYFANRLFAEDAHFRYNEPMSENEFLPAVVKRTYGR